MLENVNEAQKPKRVTRNLAGLKSKTAWGSLGISLFFVLLSLTSFGQKQKVEYDKKSGYILVDGKKYAQLSKENAPGQMGVHKNFTISNLEGEELCFMIFHQEDIYKNGYKTGDKRVFYTIVFAGSDQSSEKDGTMGASGAAKLMAKNKLIVNGEIDPDAEKKFHLKY